MKRACAVFYLLTVGTPIISFAQGGPPCWDKVAPSTKYANHHVVSGGNNSSSADGLIISTGLTDEDSFLRVEVTITNCSGSPITVNPKNFVLVKHEPQADIKLASLDPTHYVGFPKTGKTYPPLVSETLPYGRIGSYQLFFERDGRAQPIDSMHSNYRLGLTVPLERWEFNFEFPRKKL